MPAASRWRRRRAAGRRAGPRRAGDRDRHRAAAPRLEPTDLPVGPDAEASAPSPAVVEQKAVEADRAAARRRRPRPTIPIGWSRRTTPRSPKEERPEVDDSQRRRRSHSVAAEATARRRAEGAGSHPSGRAGAGNRRERAARARPGRRSSSPISTNTSAIRPTAAPRAEVVVGFVLDRAGMSSRRASSKARAMRPSTQAALAMMQRADPVPAPPPLVADEGLSFTLPVIFQAKGNGENHRQHRPRFQINYFCLSRCCLARAGLFSLSARPLSRRTWRVRARTCR